MLTNEQQHSSAQPRHTGMLQACTGSELDSSSFENFALSFLK
jgi:hypothetical protein